MPGSRIVVRCSGVCLRIPDVRRCLIRCFDAPDSGRQCVREESLRRFIIAALGRVHLACLFERIDGFGNIFAVHTQSFGNIAGAHGFSRIPHGFQNVVFHGILSLQLLISFLIYRGNACPSRLFLAWMAKIFPVLSPIEAPLCSHAFFSSISATLPSR